MNGSLKTVRGLLCRALLVVSLNGVALTSILAAGANAESDKAQGPGAPVGRLHFAGLEAVRAGDGGSAAQEILALPVTEELKNDLARKLAGAFARNFAQENGADEDVQALLEPMLRDLSQFEWTLQWYEAGPERPWLLVVSLPEEARARWTENLDKVQAIKRGPSGKSIAFKETGKWLRVASSSDWLDLELLPGIEAKRENGDKTWLTLSSELSALQGLLKSPEGRQPKLELTVNGRGEYVRADGRVIFERDIPLALEPWVVPTNTIQDPYMSLISFTAVQGFRPWLADHWLVKKLSVDPVPNQAFFWGLAGFPMQFLGALRLENASAVIDRFADQVLPAINTNLLDHGVGKIYEGTNGTELVWRELPIMEPYLRIADEPAGDFVQAGLLPSPGGTNPPPAALLAEVTSRTNLLYYSWEITEAKWAQITPIFQLLPLVIQLPSTSTNATTARWLSTIMPKLGNSVTEVRVESPREVAFVRNAHVGLTAMELKALSLWIESPEFPQMNLENVFQWTPLPGSKAFEEQQRQVNPSEENSQKENSRPKRLKPGRPEC